MTVGLGRRTGGTGGAGGQGEWEEDGGFGDGRRFFCQIIPIGIKSGLAGGSVYLGPFHFGVVSKEIATTPKAVAFCQTTMKPMVSHPLSPILFGLQVSCSPGFFSHVLVLTSIFWFYFRLFIVVFLGCLCCFRLFQHRFSGGQNPRAAPTFVRPPKKTSGGLFGLGAAAPPSGGEGVGFRLFRVGPPGQRAVWGGRSFGGRGWGDSPSIRGGGGG